MNPLIENLNRLGGEFLHFAWPMLWQSSLLIALVFAVDFLLARKLRAAVRHALWLVVLVKLLLPPTLALPTGAAWWLFPAQPAPQPPLARHYSVTYDQDLADASLSSLPALPAMATPPPQLNRAGWALLAAGAVSAGLLAWLLFRWGQLIAKVRAAAPESAAAGSLRDARRGTGLPDGLRIKLVAGTLSPAVCGLFRPVILLPRVLADHLPAAQLRAVLLHEAIHLRRKDIWVNFAQALLQILYWWHPLVWLANARMRRVREEAVDDAVMLALADDAEVYAPTLLEVARLAFQRPLMSLGLVGIMESRSALRQRVERLLNFRAPRRAGLTLVSLGGLFLFSAVALPMGQSQAQSEKDAPATAVVAAAPATTPPVVPAADPQTNPPAVLVEAAFYRMSAEQFQTLATQLPPGQEHLDENEWWTATPAEFTRLQDRLKLLGSEPFNRPRIQTTSGKAAQFFVGNDTRTDLEFDCLPVVTGQTVNLTVQGEVTDQSRNILLTNQFHVVATPENFGGLALRLKSPDSLTSSNVIALIGVQIIANNPATGLISFPATETLPDSLATTNGDSAANLITKTFLLKNPRSEAEIKQLLVNAGVQMPPATFLISPTGILVVRGTPEQLDLAAQIARKLNGFPAASHQTSHPATAPGTNTAPATASTQLFNRTFRIDPFFFIPYCHAHGIAATNHTSEAIKIIFNQMELNFDPAQGKSIFYNEKLGYLFIKSTESDLDTVEKVLQVFSEPPVQLHVKARFIEVPKDALNDVDKFLLATNTAGGQRLGFMSDKNTRMLLKKWGAQTNSSIETLGEPEITVWGGRQVQMRATDISNIVTNMSFHSYYTNRSGSNVIESAVVPDTSTVETGPILDATMQVLDDGNTINLRAAASLIEFYGYATPPKRMATHSATNATGEILNLPNIWPAFQIREQHATVNLWDNQTLVLWLGQGQPHRPADSSPARVEAVTKHIQAAEKKKQANDVIVLITATIVDAAGSRVHPGEGLPSAETGIPPQPAAPGK